MPAGPGHPLTHPLFTRLLFSPHTSSCKHELRLELQTKVRENFTEKTQAFSWLKAPTSPSTFEKSVHELRHEENNPLYLFSLLLFGNEMEEKASEV